MKHISEVLGTVLAAVPQEPWGKVVLQGVELRCPWCDGCANRVGQQLECCWCGLVSERNAAGKWHVVDACKLADGSWPEHDGRAL